MRKLKLLLATLALLVGGVSTASAYQTPTADGIYYLYNTACTDGTPGFMSTGNGYGFQVVIDNFGFPLKLISTGADNTYQFQFIHHEGFLSDDGWMYSDGGNTGENPRARTITVQDQGDGKYKLINTNNNKEIEDWYGNVVGDGTGNRHNYLWQFLSKAERDAIIAGYTTSVKTAAATSMGMPASVDDADKFDAYLSTNYIGIDVSAKIQNGTFDTNHNTTGWTTTANSNREFNIGWGNADPKTTPEVYEGAGAISQTITVDKVGLYRLSVNATYRCGNSENNNRIGDLGYDGSVAYLKANDNIAKISDWYSGKIGGNGPGSPSEANSTYFSAGKYLTEVFVYVGDTKTIDISLHSHAMTWGGWLMFNNFKLTYYSNEVSDADATALLALVPTGKMNATVKSTLDGYISALESEKSVANYNALSLYLPTAQASADIYEAINTAIGDYATKASALDAAGQAAYDASAIQTKYDDGTYTTLAEAEADLSAALIAAIKVQTSENSDWTGLIVNPSFESDFSNGWTNTGMARQNNTSFAKTGTYYAEKWEPKGTFSVKQTIKDLPAGVYSISAKALARSVTSAKLFAADSEQAITIGEASGDYTVEFLQEADGDLTFGFEGVGDGTGTSWLCVDNFTMKFVHAAPIAVTIAASGYSTIASASALDCANLPDGLKAYKVSSISASAVTLEEVKTAVAAGTGLVLNGTASTAYAIPVVASGTDISATNKLKAAVTATEVAANAAYVLKGGKFCLVNAASTVPAGKAYLLASDVPASARDLSIIFDGGATAIDGVAVSESNNGAVYNLQGQRVTKAQKGLYIQNGKKVLK